MLGFADGARYCAATLTLGGFHWPSLSLKLLSMFKLTLAGAERSLDADVMSGVLALLWDLLGVVGK